MTEITLEARVAALESRVTAMEPELRVNTQITASIKDDTQELIGLFKASKWIVKIVTWVSGIAAAGISAYGVMRGLR